VCDSQRGGVLIELSIAIPILLCGIMIAILTASLSQARAVLTSSVGNSVRLAASRSESELFGGSPPIGAVENFNEGGLEPVLKYISHRITPEVAKATYDKWIEESLGESLGSSSCNLTSILESGCGGQEEYGADRKYLYALIYALQEIRHGIGPTVRFPCDPTKSEVEGGGIGCVKCTFVPESELINFGYSPTTFGIRCELAPDLGVITPIMRLLSIWSGTGSSNGGAPIILSRHKIIDSDYKKLAGALRG